MQIRNRAIEEVRAVAFAAARLLGFFPHESAPAATQDFDRMSGVEFEAWISRLLREKGFKVYVTPATGVQGADLVARGNGKSIVIQLNRGSVGNEAVQEVTSALAYYGGDEGWVITNASFTPSAKALAQQTNIRLVDGAVLKAGDIEF